jgi:hypothetical protein
MHIELNNINLFCCSIIKGELKYTRKVGDKLYTLAMPVEDRQIEQIRIVCASAQKACENAHTAHAKKHYLCERHLDIVWKKKEKYSSLTITKTCSSP